MATPSPNPDHKPQNRIPTNPFPTFFNTIAHHSQIHPSSSTMESSAGKSIMSSLLRHHHPALPLHSLAADLRLRRRRLLFLLTSPPHFSLALSHLRSLSLAEKTLLLSRLLLRSLSLLLSPLNPITSLRHRDFDVAVLLLLAMTDAYTPIVGTCIDWRLLISRRVAPLSPAGLGAEWWPTIGPHLDAAVKCRRLTAAEI